MNAPSTESVWDYGESPIAIRDMCTTRTQRVTSTPGQLLFLVHLRAFTLFLCYFVGMERETPGVAKRTQSKKLGLCNNII